MIVKKITSQVKQSSLKDFEAIAFVEKHMENYDFAEGNGGKIGEKLYVIDKKDRVGFSGEDSYYVGKQTGADYFKCIRIEWGILYKDAVKGDIKLNLQRASVGGSGMTLADLVKDINLEVKGDYHSDYGGIRYNVYGVNNLNSVTDMTLEPVGFTPKMIKDYVNEMKPYFEKSMKGHKTIPSKKKCKCPYGLNFRGML